MKRRNRNIAYEINRRYRVRLRNLFCSWRGTTHAKFKKRIDKEQESFRLLKRQEYRLSDYQKKANALKIYMAQLQEKITIEVAAKEELARTYELSLNKGVYSLNEETRNLSENPLVKEISIIVAQEIMRKTQGETSLSGVKPNNVGETSLSLH
mmetsp:Transcript_41292/g.39768  ORF Transcript_41292/g.39768 Transcript_41292/m.39768 type:complete len:153 (-) Transcript_41292:41-499(-)